MKLLVEQVFLSEIVLQSRIAFRAAKGLLSIHDHIDKIEVLSSIQSILVAAGNVSKILWPSNKYTERGEALRKLLNIEDDNILSDRTFRNHFEHYDDRVEIWFENTPSAVYTDLVFDSFDSIWGPNPINRHRAYNPFTKTLTFRGESIDLTEVLKSLEVIENKCRHIAPF